VKFQTGQCQEGDYMFQPSLVPYDKKHPILLESIVVLMKDKFKSLMSNDLIREKVSVNPNQILGYLKPITQKVSPISEVVKSMDEIVPPLIVPISLNKLTGEAQDKVVTTLLDDPSVMSFNSSKGYDIELKVGYDGLERTQLEKLKALILEYKDTCVVDQSEVTIARGYEYAIQVKDGSKVVNQKPSRMSPEKRELAGNFLDKMLLAGTIEPSSSQYNSRFLLISKPDGSFRPVVDF